jgi:hypothetical protein
MPRSDGHTRAHRDRKPSRIASLSPGVGEEFRLHCREGRFVGGDHDSLLEGEELGSNLLQAGTNALAFAVLRVPRQWLAARRHTGAGRSVERLA